jgi:hypothetical protein
VDGSEADAGIDYQGLMRSALRDVVRRVLAHVAEHGLPGEHHLYLTFATAHDGVELPAGLRRQHPDEMTIVLQHQFWNLAADDAGFAVTLRFSGRPERLVVPWPALRAFADPSVDFGFRLQPATERATAAEKPAASLGPRPVEPAGETPRAPVAEPGTEGEPAPAPQPTPDGGAGKVVDFGSFRRRSPDE